MNSVPSPIVEGHALDRVEKALRDAGKGTNGHGVWQCPAHDDKNPSLSVKCADDKVLLNCFAGCKAPEIAKALGLEMQALWDAPAAQDPQSKRVNEYVYVDRQAETLSIKERWEPGANGRSKSFRWSDGNPGVLYNLPELIEAEHVHICEGEKAANRLNHDLPAGCVATCAPTTKWESKFTEHLVRKIVTIWVDRDESGLKQAAKVYAALVAAGITASVVQSATITEKSDAWDHLEAGFGVGDAVRMDPAKLPGIGGGEAGSQIVGGLAVPAVSAPKAEFGGFPFRFFADIDYRVGSRGLVKGVIGMNAFVVLFGPSGCSKTFVGVQLALCVGSGREWHGRRVSKHLAIYIAAEGGASISNRIAAYRDEYLKGREDVLFALLPEPVSLLDQDAAVDRLIPSIKEVEEKLGEKCGLVVIDTLSQSIEGGDENSPGTMTEAVGAVNRIRNEVGSAVVLVHHTGKDLTKGARGHSSLRAAADTELEVSALGKDTFEIRPTKQRDLGLGEPFLYRLKVVDIGEDEDGEMQTTCVVEPIDPEDVAIKRKRRGKLGARSNILQRCMEDLFKSNRGFTAPSEVRNSPANGLKAGQFVINVSDLRELFVKRIGDDPDMQDSPRDSLRKAFKRTLEATQGSGNVCVYEEYVWFTE